MIEIQDLTKRFGKVEVLRSLDLNIKESGIFAVLGPNGSGKTTLIKSILGMVMPNKGSIQIRGKEVIGKYKHREHICYLPQIANFPGNLTVLELINMITDLRGQTAEYQHLIEAFQLQPFINKKLGHLSGGTRQKVNIVLAFMFNGDLIILDEPTTGLDPVSLIKLKEMIQKRKAEGKTILITSHIISFVEEVADEIVFLLEGKIHFKGTVKELETQTQQNNLEYAIASLLEQHHV